MIQAQTHASAADVERLTPAAAALGYEIVDIAGFLDLVEAHARAQTNGLNVLKTRAADVSAANGDVMEAAAALAERTGVTVTDVSTSVERVRTAGGKTRAVATWVQNVSERTDAVAETISAVRNNNQQIASIATQVNTLAINAKIEAARAGDSGRGFAVVAEAINELSRKTSTAAVEISRNIETITSWITALSKEAIDISKRATEVLAEAEGTDGALGRVERSIAEADGEARRIADRARKVETAMRDFKPALDGIASSIAETSSGIESTHARVLSLIDTSETIVQSTALMTEHSEDAKFIKTVQGLAEEVARRMELSVVEGRTSLSRLFDRNYRLIPGSNPEQFLTEATALLDEILPPVQEPALQLDPKVVFCAAVDENGYLPTHNRKFSQPPGSDPVWNTANCRNRRIFDDRVGLKAGRNREPFLLQVYRRDMGGGTFKMMKDLSAPIVVRGRHWGGLRLAYAFD